MTVVLLSGGLDSAVCLALEAKQVDCLTVDYGQRHRKEIDAAANLADMYGARHTVIELDPRLFQGSALTGGRPIPTGHAETPDATYVPARNTVLLALAAAYSESIGSRRIVIGANADDAGAYPDCGRKYLELFRDLLLAGTVGHVWVQAPLLGKTKSEVRQMAAGLGVPVELTWSCYAGNETPCGVCGACQ